MKSMTVRFTADEVLIGRHEKLAWDNQSVLGMYHAVTATLQEITGVDRINLVNDGLQQTCPMRWKIVTEIWVHAWIVRCNLNIAVRGLDNGQLHETVLWTRRTSNAIAPAVAPNVLPDWSLMIDGERLPIVPQDNNPWLTVEDMRWGCQLTNFAYEMRHRDYLDVQISTVREFEDNSDVAKRLTIAGNHHVVVTLPLALIDDIVTTGRLSRAHGRLVVSQQVTPERPLKISYYLDGRTGLSFEQVALQKRARWQTFWARTDVQISADHNWQRNIRWALYRTRLQLGEQKLYELLLQPATDLTGSLHNLTNETDLEERLTGFLSWLTGGCVINNELCLTCQPKLPAVGTIAWTLQNEHLNIWCLADSTRLRIRPDAPLCVQTGSECIKCPRQRLTTIVTR